MITIVCGRRHSACVKWQGYYPGGRLRVHGDSILLAVGSGLMLLLVAADFLTVPGPWADIMAPVGVPDWGVKEYLDGAVFVMTRTHGATIALKVALASLAFAVASLVVTKAGKARSDGGTSAGAPVPDDSWIGPQVYRDLDR